jgi:hypothetical protein
MEETAEIRLEQFAAAMEAESAEMIPPSYQTPQATQFIADIREVLAKLAAT